MSANGGKRTLALWPELVDRTRPTLGFPRVESGHRRRYVGAMAHRKEMLFCSPALFILSACGDYLGEYRLENVKLVGAMPAASFSRYSSEPVISPYAKNLRIEISSNTDLSTFETGAGLYSHADFCPFKKRYRVSAYGPVASDGSPAAGWARTNKLNPQRDGRYHYFVYVPPQTEFRRWTANPDDDIPALDLIKKPRSLCLRFDVPGYNIVPSESAVIEIPIERIERAVREAQMASTS